MRVSGIASIPTRKENLIKVIGSLIDQVDELYVALNNYSEIPQELRDNPKIHCDLLDNRYGDGAKFYHVSDVDGYYFSADDDLFYPPAYVKDTIKAIEKYHCIVTYHGKRFDKRPILSYHRSFTTNVRCLNSYPEDIEVHVGGTGVMAFNTKDFRLSIDAFKEPNMADIWVAKEASLQGVKIMALAHHVGYFQYLGTPDTPIWQLRRGNAFETNLLKSFLK